MELRPLWRCPDLSLGAFSAASGVDIAPQPGGHTERCAVIVLRGHASSDPGRAHLHADNVTAAYFNCDGRSGPCLVAGDGGVGGLLIGMSPGGAAALSPPGTSGSVLPNAVPIVTDPCDHLEAWLLIAALDQGSAEHRSAAEAAGRRLATSLLRGAYRAAPSVADGSTPAHNRAPIADTRRRIAAAVERPATLRLLAADSGWSPWYLSRRFSAEVGLPLHRYLMRARLRAALARVIGTHEPLSQVAAAVGFSSHSHFTSAFRAEFGTTPIAVRQLREPSQAADLRKVLSDGLVRQIPSKRNVITSAS